MRSELQNGSRFPRSRGYHRYMGYGRYGREDLDFPSEVILYDFYHKRPHPRGIPVVSYLSLEFNWSSSFNETFLFNFQLLKFSRFKLEFPQIPIQMRDPDRKLSQTMAKFSILHLVHVLWSTDNPGQSQIPYFNYDSIWCLHPDWERCPMCSFPNTLTKRWDHRLTSQILRISWISWIP